MTSLAFLGAIVDCTVQKCLKKFREFYWNTLLSWFKNISNVIEIKIAYRTIQNMTKCLRALTNPSPNRGKVDSIDYLPIECKKVMSSS